MDIVRKSIGAAVAEVARTHPHRPALVHAERGTRLDYAGLSGDVDRIARGFLALGVRPGGKVALWAPNEPEWVPAFLGLTAIGAVTVPIDPAAGREHLGYILRQSEASAAVVGGLEGQAPALELWRAVRTETPGLKRVAAMPGPAPPDALPWPGLLDGGARVSDGGLQAARNAVSPDDPVAIMYTSGTTGPPKGVVLDHLGLVNKSLHATARQGITAADRLCLFFPLFHMFGNTCIALAGLLRGAALVMPGRRFDPVKVLEVLAGERCTAIYGSPSMLIALVDHPAFRRQDWRALKKGIIGGAPCPAELMRRLVGEIGIENITVAWGITETSSWITMTLPEDPIARRVATIGRPLPCCEVRIVDPRTGEALPAGRQGELCTRGFLMTEYFKMPAATAAAVDREGWFHTGDLGVMDPEGYVTISGRLKDVIVRDGQEITAVEVEEVIYRLADVSEVQVFGFPDPAKGQEVAAWIKLRDGARLTAAEVADHVARHLPAGRQPRHYKFVTGFPMTGSGKIQKYKLAELAAAEYGG
jgi:fatty-acyl-CoA synthase